MSPRDSHPQILHSDLVAAAQSALVNLAQPHHLDAIFRIAALQARFPAIAGPRRDDICYATQNRQDAVRRLAEQCALVLVVGSPNSSNSNRLRELAAKAGIPAHLIDGAADIDPAWLAGCRRIGLTAGASAPERLVQDVVDRLRALGAT